MKSANSNTKVFQEIVGQIRQIVSDDKLLPGDKLPSERELSERLHAGRSSVREGLRALELLGLIETRRGEGTFLRDFTNHHLVELISTFILQDEKVKLDVLVTKGLIEMDAIRTMVDNDFNVQAIEELKLKLTKGYYGNTDEFWNDLYSVTPNKLLYKIWLILKDYSSGLHTVREEKITDCKLKLLDAILNRDLGRALNVHGELREMSLSN
ncbi:FadR/GntR family transcriptional regulator [Heyndrickxia acidicola]|uniref:GntR family transcriptional regulator n=1 Tax=Heyndrickxia acidicola TaxID=209389 RepID=A0ABU6MFG9_9BACI|nr:GntR family transcriptional regulator [Heyndrickxia acidicola]MED1203210.1 GntR family transcriptional regulator [Heyndrickxia acidicola]